MLFIEYPKCTTCKKAKKFLDDKKIKYDERNIVIDNPTKNELDTWIKLSGKDINKFFNTSGLLYRKLNLKDKIKNMSFNEKIELLASDGILIKRPILITKNNCFIGFNEKEYSTLEKDMIK